MKIKYFITPLCVSLTFMVLNGCTKRTIQSPDVETIYVEVNKSQFSTNISPFLEDDVDVIALETNDSCLISKSLKIEFAKEDIFISDKTTEMVYRFDSSGKFLNYIGKIGTGPEEYVSLGDFDIISDLIYIQDKGLDQIIVYTFESKFVKAIKLSPSLYFDEFVNIEDDLCFVMNYRPSEIGRYNIYSMNISKGEIKGCLPYDKSIESKQKKWGLKKYISKYHEKSALAIFSNSDTVYSITKTGVSPKYQVLFSERKIPKDEIEKGGMNAMETAITKGYILGMENINDSENYLFFSYSDGDKGRDVFYSKLDKTNSVSEWLFVENLGNLYGTDYFTCNNEFVIVQDAYLYRDLWERQYSKGKFKREKDKKRMLEIYECVKEDDNPILFRFKFKNRV